MGDKPKLPVNDLSIASFNGYFKEKHLDGDILRDEDIEEIKKIFGLDDRSINNKIGAISCDEFHAHSYKCHFYFSPEAGIVDRLIREIHKYRAKLSDVRSRLE